MRSLASLCPDLGRFWTVANALSLSRLVVVVPLALLLWQDGPLEWLLGLALVAIVSDWFDGRVARWTRTVSDWGKVIDPVADKVAAVLVVSVLTFRPAEPHLPLWFFGVVLGRDALILAGGTLIARRTGKILMSAWAGKAASMWLALTVLAVILQADPPVLNVCLWMTTGLFVFSFGVYVLRYVITLRESPDDTDPGAPPVRDASDGSGTASDPEHPEPLGAPFSMRPLGGDGRSVLRSPSSLR
ncbi:MAG: CDP-alcohol phosphatidyltransferase family protein [Salinibacter sp.]